MQCEVLSGHSDPFHLFMHWMWQSCRTTGKCPQLCGCSMHLQAAHLVSLSVTFPVGNAGTEGRGGSAGVAVSFQFQVQTQYPWGACSDTSYMASCLLPECPWLSRLFCLFPAGALHVPAGAPWAWGGREMCSLTHLVCILQQSPLSLSSGNLYTQCDKPCLSVPISVGISCPQTEVVYFMPAFKAMALCTFTPSNMHTHILAPSSHCTFSWKKHMYG